MRSRILLLLVAVFVGACGDPRAGQRYRAERELWRADARRSELPAVAAGHRGLAALAGRYENTGRHYESAVGDDSLGLQIRALAGRAWLAAADVHLARVDSLRAEDLLDGLAHAFEERPSIEAEVAWRRGRLAEADGELELAIERYRKVISLVSPDPGAKGVADSVLHLPLRMIRLARSTSTEELTAELDTLSQTYYRTHADSDSLDVQLDVRRLRAELDLGRGRWFSAASGLDSLAARMAKVELPRHDPSELAGLAFEARCQRWLEGQEPLQALQVQFEKLRRDHPDRTVVPEALFAMALAARDRGLVEDSQRLLSQIRYRYARSEVAAEAMLTRARLLERTKRWREAYMEYRLLETEHPLSGAGLQVPLEMARHHRRLGDEPSARQALSRAELRYREILQRYPQGPHTYETRRRLIETLQALGRSEEAVTELLALAERFSGTPRELRLLVRARRLARQELVDPAAEASIVDRIVQRFPGTRVSRVLAGVGGRAGGR